MTDTSIHVDTSSFTKFSRDLKKASAELHKQLRTELKAAGEIVAADARVRAGFSSRIPQRIKVGVRANQIRVYVRPIKDKPHAGEEFALENKGRDGYFRHPVNKDRSKWGRQKAEPYLKPALEANRGTAVRSAKRAVDKALREVHSHE